MFAAPSARSCMFWLSPPVDYPFHLVHFLCSIDSLILLVVSPTVFYYIHLPLRMFMVFSLLSASSASAVSELLPDFLELPLAYLYLPIALPVSPFLDLGPSSPFLLVHTLLPRSVLVGSSLLLGSPLSAK